MYIRIYIIYKKCVIFLFRSLSLSNKLQHDDDDDDILSGFLTEVGRALDNLIFNSEEKFPRRKHSLAVYFGYIN